jgi:hypothetical protein
VGLDRVVLLLARHKPDLKRGVRSGYSSSMPDKFTVLNH